MKRLIHAGARSGSVVIPASKSQAHRLLICSALAHRESTLICRGISEDISATISCLNALGAHIAIKGDTLVIRPVSDPELAEKHLFCRESGSTLRFLLPVAGALGENALFHMEGRLPLRPMEPLTAALTEHGMYISRQDDLLICCGKLQSGSYTIAGNVSSQFISGLLMALPLLKGDSTLEISGAAESADYIAMTESVLRLTGILFEKKANGYYIYGGQHYCPESIFTVEQDWSSAAFFLCMGAFSDKGIAVKGMSLSSLQGDKQILPILRDFGAVVETGSEQITVRRGKLSGCCVDASGIPDLIPVICVLAAGAEGETRIINGGRLRFKETDRLRTTAQMLASLGADITETADGLIIKGKQRLSGGKTDSFNDHRIAMSAAVAAGICENDVTVDGAECTEKSYPGFWEDLEKMEING